jgi:hypothetical protein
VPVRLDAHRLRGVFDHGDAADAAQLAHALDVGWNAEQMMRDHTQGVVVERRFELVVIEVKRRWIDVAQDWLQAGADHRGRHGVARVGGNHDLGPG